MSPALNLVLRDARPGDGTAVTALLAEAHHASTLGRWLDPNPDSRHEHLTRILGRLTAEAITDGVARVATENGKPVGAALWIPTPPGPTKTTTRDDASIPGAAQRLVYLDTVLTKRRPTNQPYQHLAFVGVHPDRQGRGIGRELLIARQPLLHTTGVPAYLEATDPRARDLFLRLGYTDIGAPVALPGGVPIWAMWRDPVPADFLPNRSATKGR